jgi:hypothetical protein
MRITRPLPGCMRNRELVAKSTSCAIEIRRLLLLTMGLIVSLKRLYLVLHIDLYWPFAVMPCSTRYPHHTSVILPSVIWQVATEKWGRSYPVIDSTGGSKEIIGIEQTDFVCIKGCICIVRSSAFQGTGSKELLVSMQLSPLSIQLLTAIQ